MCSTSLVPKALSSAHRHDLNAPEQILQPETRPLGPGEEGLGSECWDTLAGRESLSPTRAPLQARGALWGKAV